MVLVMEGTMTDKKREAWGKWFESATHAAGYKSQQEFASASGFTRVQVQRWETGAVRPREENIPAIAAALKSVATLEEVYHAAGYTPDRTEDEQLSDISQRLGSSLIVAGGKEPMKLYPADETIEVSKETILSIQSGIAAMQKAIEEMSKKLEEKGKE
jgi:transcriptional regulator with XRE-family HTH domain